MKRIVALLLLVSLVVGTAACGGKQESTEKITSMEQLEGKTIALGKNPNEKEAIINGPLKKTLNGVVVGDLVVAETSSLAVMMLKNGQCDAALTPLFASAQYFEAQNDDILAIDTDHKVTLTMIGRTEDQELVDDVDGAIDELRENGKLKETVDTWITNKDLSSEAVNEVPTIDGARTIKVGISGDALPLDYVTSDGKAAGFNVALMTEISQIINKNIEFVVMSADNRFTAVLSGKIDLFFWHITETQPPEGVATTQGYFEQSIGLIVKK